MSKQHTTAAIIFALVILLVLAVMPAQAQCDADCSAVPEPPVASAQNSTMYLAQISWRFPMWFTDAELQQAQRDAGYDIDTAQMHTACTLDASATPPHDLRYLSCEQYFINGIGPTEGTSHYIWWLRLNDGRVHGVEVGGTMVQSAGTDAPCYVEDDGEIACG